LLATGGGARNETWLSYIAAATGIPIDLPADGDFGAALGAARLAMMAGGASVADVCHKPATRLTFEPDPALAAGLGAAHERWRQIYRQLQD
jgi:xylulokinase